MENSYSTNYTANVRIAIKKYKITMSCIVLIIKLRFIQLFRALSGGGIIRIFFVITVLLIANAVLFNELAKGKNDTYFVFGYLALIFLIHIKRSNIFSSIKNTNYKLITELTK